MGAVYQAKDMKRQGTTCAIKEMSLSMVPPEEQAQAIKNFKIEAKMLSVLSHPYLPAFTHFFAENQRYFLVMEYIDGKTLEDLLERNGGPFSEKRVLTWADQLCEVLEYLHSQNPPIIFRDMKPGNIMLTRQGYIKLIDFGIARFFRSTSATDTQMLGTPGYAPPEQYGTVQTDERSDIYALGMTLAHLLTNRFSEQGFGVKAKDIRAINPQVSLPVARALEKATALEPSDRFEDAAAFRRALLGAASFTFESGASATGPEELAELCGLYPEEAAEYLESGEIADWLFEMGEEELGEETLHIRDMQVNAYNAVEQFIRLVLGPHGGLRNYSQPVVPIGQATPWEKRAAVLEQTVSSQSSSQMTPIAPATSLLVSPRTLDFGAVYPPGNSVPLTVTIEGNDGRRVRGTLHSMESWIRVDRADFDGVTTCVTVRVHATQLRPYTHYRGAILVSPEDERIPEVSVAIEADIQGYSLQARRPGKTISPEDDDDEDDVDVADLNMLIGESSQVQQVQQIQQVRQISQVPKPREPATEQEREWVAKYGQMDTQQSWTPYLLTPRQQLLTRYSLAFVAACMVASLWYTLISASLPEPLHKLWLFSITIWGLAPCTTIGALLTKLDSNWKELKFLDRVIIGFSSSLLSLSLSRTIWQLLLPGTSGGAIQILLSVLIAAAGAAIGTQTTISSTVVTRLTLFMRKAGYARGMVLFFILLLGGIFGFMLTSGLAVGCFAAVGPFLGLAAAVALIWRVNQTQMPLRRS